MEEVREREVRSALCWDSREASCDVNEDSARLARVARRGASIIAVVGGGRRWRDGAWRAACDWCYGGT